MIWYLSAPERFHSECEAIDSLTSQSPWLTAVNWRMDSTGRVVCDVDIEVGPRRFPVMLQYNDAFPNTPPSIFPRVNERWSAHQYGEGGELCLEYGPDNWQSSLTGADMLASAFKLLSEETSGDNGEIRPPVASRHALTLGQSLRLSQTRAFYSLGFLEAAGAVKNIAEVKLKYRLGGNAEPLVMWPQALDYLNGSTWSDSSIPDGVESADNVITVGFSNCQDDFDLQKYKSPNQLLDALFGEPEEGVERKAYWCVVLLWKGEIFIIYLNRAEDTLQMFSMIPPNPGNRLSKEHSSLNQKKIGIVGCGSIGSKIAAMIARSGVGSFVLVDDDIFGPENLVRNELDWRAVGDHKVDALSKHLKLINAHVEVTPKKHNLGGQESAIALHGLLSMLKSCDLLIDATATGAAFNYISSVADAEKIPMLWAEVFAGGIGGLIARSRPGHEPSPQEARGRILHWCREQNKPVPFAAGNNYEGAGDAPLIADDSSVSIIASHAASLAIDTLLTQGEGSNFPQSAYLIGMRKDWIFTQPFDVHPINLGQPSENGPTTDVDDAERKAGIARIAALLGKAAKDNA